MIGSVRRCDLSDLSLPCCGPAGLRALLPPLPVARLLVVRHPLHRISQLLIVAGFLEPLQQSRGWLVGTRCHSNHLAFSLFSSQQKRPRPRGRGVFPKQAEDRPPGRSGPTSPCPSVP